MTFGKQSRRRMDEDQRILPLINIVFLLLIFFLVAGQLARTDPIELEPPVSESELSAGDGGLRLFVAADGLIHADSGLVEINQLGALLQSEGSQAIVRVKADANVEAAHVVDILNRLRDAGAEKVQLITAVRPGS